MNHILHNIALIIVFFGIILMTIYVTKSKYNKPRGKSHVKYSVDDNDNMSDVDAAYNERVSKKFKSMFDENSPWLNKYSAIDNVQKAKNFY